MVTSVNDHEFKIDSTTRKLDLMRDEKTGEVMFQAFDDVPQYNTRLTFEQTNWVGGHGKWDFDPNEPDRYIEGYAIDTFLDGNIILGPLIVEVKESDDTTLDSAVAHFVYFNATSEWLCATAGKIYRYNVGANLKWTAATTTVAGVTGFMEHNSVMYACLGASTKYYYSTDGITWTQTDLTDGYANGMLSAPNAAGTANVLWKFKTPNEISQTTDGRTSAAGGVQWSTAAYVGDTSNNITRIFLINDRLMIGRTDELYWYDPDGGVHPLMGDLHHNKSTNNFKYSTEWQTSTYFSLGDGLGEITSYDAFEPMGPLTGIDDILKKGTCVGLASDKNFIYAAMDEGALVHIYKGRETSKNGGLRWEWCPFIKLGVDCATARVCQHSATDRRLWFGYGTHTAYAYLSDNPLADTAYKYAPAGFMIMPYTAGSNQYWTKMWQSLVTETAGCASSGGYGTIYVTPYYYPENYSAAVVAGNVITNGTVKTTFTTAILGNKTAFGIALVTGTNTITPQLKFFQARGIERPETVRIYEAIYKVAGRPSVATDTLRDFLRTGRDSTALIKFADLRFGESTASTSYKWVVFEPGFPIEVEVSQGKGRLPEMGVKVRMREVSFTVS